MKIIIIAMVFITSGVNGRSEFGVPSDEEYLAHKSIDTKLGTNYFDGDEFYDETSFDEKPEKSLTFMENLPFRRSYQSGSHSSSNRHLDPSTRRRSEMENGNDPQRRARRGPPTGFHFVRGKKSITV